MCLCMHVCVYMCICIYYKWMYIIYMYMNVFICIYMYVLYGSNNYNGMGSMISMISNFIIFTISRKQI